MLRNYEPAPDVQGPVEGKESEGTQVAETAVSLN